MYGTGLNLHKQSFENLNYSFNSGAHTGMLRIYTAKALKTEFTLETAIEG